MSYSGFANGENSSVINTLPTATSPAILTSNTGGYSITAAGGIDDNYDFNYVPGTLTITKGLVTVNADNQSRVYGVANPTLTMSYSGFANGENSSVINTLPTATSPAILTSNTEVTQLPPAGGIDDNYDFNYVPGTLTITKGLVTVNADNQSRVYGVANPTLTMSYSGVCQRRKQFGDKYFANRYFASHPHQQYWRLLYYRLLVESMIIMILTMSPAPSPLQKG
ncbi:MAG: hypothetical protein IPK96_19645 [Flammeovirgaceae bacterium]|nr:hypothetical protein [Flammeovirgaceae bacterium]